jgi:hypothetical protein
MLIGKFSATRFDVTRQALLPSCLAVLLVLKLKTESRPVLLQCRGTLILITMDDGVLGWGISSSQVLYHHSGTKERRADKNVNPSHHSDELFTAHSLQAYKRKLVFNSNRWVRNKGCLLSTSIHAVQSPFLHESQRYGSITSPLGIRH